jgi:hypothetical protein
MKIRIKIMYRMQNEYEIILILNDPVCSIISVLETLAAPLCLEALERIDDPPVDIYLFQVFLCLA